MPSLRDAMENFGRSTGEYWSQDNAQFEGTNPSIPARVVRAINPMSGFGSALGAMHDAASNGFPVVDTGVALMQALPLFGATRAVQTAGHGAIKGAQTISPDLFKTLMGFLGGTGLSVGADAAQAAQPPKKQVN